MVNVIRMSAPVAVLLFAISGAGAQPPEAPPPHPPLAELVKECRRFGLPLLPENAQLVRIERYRYRWATNLEKDEPRYDLAFRIPPARPGDRAKRMAVSNHFLFPQLEELEYVEPGTVEAVTPLTAALESVGVEGGRYCLYLAVLCRDLGWVELASALYSQARAQFAADDDHVSVADELRPIAWQFWLSSLTARGTDRGAALRQLKTITAEDETLRTPKTDRFFHQLELTLAPRTSKPGTIEALIDDLTEYWDAPHNFPPQSTVPTSYWQLAELGFDAVPALIAHLNDDRLTRAYGLGSQFGTSHHLTVGHLCSRLLFYLSAGTISANQQWEAGGARLDPAEVRKWFAVAHKVGEEQWLVRHAVPPFVGRAIAYREDRPVFVGKGLVSHEGRTEPHIVRVLGARYPARLTAVYRTMLRISVEGGVLNDFVNELVASKLPRDQKIALLEEGAASDSPDHWVPALEGLARLDRVRLRRHLKPALMRVWLRAWLGHPDPKDGSRLVRLAEAADDRGCWEALASATRAVGVECRTDVIRHIVPCAPPDRPDPARPDRIRFLMPFLDDRTVDRDEDGTGPEVRDCAASQLAGLLGFRVQRDPFLYRPVFDAERDPISRVVLRMTVRQAGARILAEKN